jgi:hypothetical protein
MMRAHIPAVLLSLAASAFAKSESPLPTANAIDISAVADKLVVFSDGKSHYLALTMATELDAPAYWSADGKSFYQLRVFGGGSEGDAKDLKRLDRVFWEPRVNAPYQASFDYRGEDKKLTVQCSDRKTALAPLAAADAKTLVSASKFYQPRWNRRAYALARDNTGTYYYVDNQREPEGSKNFRLWSGPKGALKPLKMTNVVSDSEGDIFATKVGSLRLVLDKHETVWIKNEKKTKLVFLPVEDNHILIYTDLGAYTGEPLGTPCDDL